MREVKQALTLLAFLLAMMGGCATSAVAQAPPATTTVQDTLYTANGTPAGGTVLLSWSAFTTAGGVPVAAGTTSVTIGAGGVLTVALAPNAGATPMGSYYTAVLHLSDGTTSRQFWVVPVTVPGGGPAKLAAIQNQVLPTSVAMQTVSKQYVDNAIAAAMTGYVSPSSSPFLLKAGDTMTGPLVLPADPASPLQAADKNYVDQKVGLLPVFGPSGTGHAPGLVPDPGATAGATRFLREDGGWSVPASSGAGIAMPAATSRNAVNTVYQNITGYNALEVVSVTVGEYSNPTLGFNIGAGSGSVTMAVVPAGIHSGYTLTNEDYNFSFAVPAGWYMELTCSPGGDCAGTSVRGWVETTLP